MLLFLVQKNLVKANITLVLLHFTYKCCLLKSSVQAQQSKMFSYLVPHWWNDLLSTVRAGATLSLFKKLLQTQLL